MHDNFHIQYDHKIDLLFMGSSRCTAHFDPGFFDSAYHLRSLNFGIDGHSELEIHILKLNSYLKRNKPPKVIVMNFDLLTNTLGQSGKNYVHKNYFSRYAFLPFSEEPGLSRYFNYNFLEKYIPAYALLRYKFLSSALLNDKGNNWEKEGYARHDAKWDTIKNPVKPELKCNSYKSDKQFLTSALSTFYSICKKNKIKLILVQTPLFKKVYRECDLTENEGIAHALGIPFCDMNNEILNSDIDNFYNSTHLNAVGVGKLSRYMAEDACFNNFMKTEFSGN